MLTFLAIAVLWIWLPFAGCLASGGAPFGRALAWPLIALRHWLRAY